jgi:hypothetical protein
MGWWVVRFFSGLCKIYVRDKGWITITLVGVFEFLGVDFMAGAQPSEQVIGSGTNGVNGNNRVYRNGKPVDPGSQTTSSVTPPASINKERELQRSITAVNTSLKLSPDGKTIVAGQSQLNTLGQALEKTGQTAELSASVLTRGLSNPKDPKLQAQAVETLQAELSKKQYGEKIKLPKEAEGAGAPKLAEKEDKKPKLEHTLKLNDNGKGGASNLKVMLKPEEYDVFFKSQPSDKPDSPAVSIFRNPKEQGIAYIVVSRRDETGKIQSTEVATVKSADDLTNPLKDTKIFSKGGKEKLGTMSLDGLDVAKMREALRSKLEKPKLENASETPAGGGNEGAGNPSYSGVAGGGSGGGGSVPPKLGSGGPTTPTQATTPTPAAPKPTAIIVDGALNKSEMVRFLNAVNESSGSVSVTEKLKEKFPDATVSGDRDKVTLVFDKATVRIAWKDGSASIESSENEQQRKAWIKAFEQKIDAIIKDPNANTPVVSVSPAEYLVKPA